MPGILSRTEQIATLDQRFPNTGSGDHYAYSTNGTSEWAGLARTPVGTWLAATNADPSVKGNASALTSAAASAAGTVTHWAIYSALTGGTQRTDWIPLTASRTLAVGDRLTHAVNTMRVTLD